MSGKTLAPRLATVLGAAVFLLGILLGILPAFPSAAAPAPPAPPAPANTTTKVAIWVNDIWNLNMSKSSAEAEFYLTLNCSGPCAPEQIDMVDGQITERRLVAHKGNTYEFHMRAIINITPQLSQFPFDKQTLKLSFENEELNSQQLQLVADPEHSGLDPDLHIFDWEVLGWSMKSGSHGYGDFDDPFDRVSFNIDIERSEIGSALKIFLPIFTIAAVAFISTLIHDPREQRKASGTALIGMVLFWIGLNTLTPATNYLTFLDKVLVLIYVLIGWILVCSVWCQKSDERQLASGNITEGEKSRTTRWLRRGTIVGFPLVLIVGTAIAWFTSTGR